MQSDEQKASQMWVNLFSATSRVCAASGQRHLLEAEKLQNKLENKRSHEVIHVNLLSEMSKTSGGGEHMKHMEPYSGKSFLT